MTIQSSPRHWSASVKFKADKAKRDAAYALLAELGVCGKGKRYRYLGDRNFKSREACEAYYKPLIAKHPLLAELLEIHEGFFLMF